MRTNNNRLKMFVGIMGMLLVFGTLLLADNKLSNTVFKTKAEEKITKVTVFSKKRKENTLLGFPKYYTDYYYSKSGSKFVYMPDNDVNISYKPTKGKRHVVAYLHEYSTKGFLVDTSSDELKMLEIIIYRNPNENKIEGEN